MKYQLTIALLMALAAVSRAPGARAEEIKIELLSRTAVVTVLVSDEEKALDRLAAEAANVGGYFAERDAHRLKAKIPAGRADDYLKLVTSLGSVVENRYASDDLTANRARLKSALDSRKAMLARYLAAMSGTRNRDDLRTIEAATKSLLAEVEHGEGNLRLMDHNARYATVDVSFQLRDRTPVRVIHENHFAWLGTVGLGGLLADFASASEAK